MAGLRATVRSIAGAAHVAAAIAVRAGPAGGAEYLLVRTSDGLRWTFPKGRRERGESLAEAAAREAGEEAGVAGRAGVRLGTYRYPSARGSNRTLVAAFLLDVERTGLPAEPGREPTWFSLEAARSRLALDRPSGYGEQMERLLLAGRRAARLP